MNTSAIGWTDFSGGDLNFVTGCTPVSEGCANCYARRIYERFGREFSQVRFHEDKLRRLWREAFPQYSSKRGAPHKPMAFVVDTGDIFHPDLDAIHPDGKGGFFVFWAFMEVVIARQDVVWQVLTKRADRMHVIVKQWRECMASELPPNLWLGVTAETQRCADERIPLLLDTPAAVRFVSVEPMLGPVDMARVPGFNKAGQAGIDLLRNWWVIAGAESGPKRRPFCPQWAVRLYEQCQNARVPFFGKQDSAARPGKPLVLGEYGVVHEWPEDTL